MSTKEKNGQTPSEGGIRRSALITVVCDVVLILVLVVCLLTYISSNNASTYSQNVESITNTAAAKAELMVASLESISNEVKMAYRCGNGMGLTEMLDFLSVASGSDGEYQLLRRDEERSTEEYHVYAGYSTKKAGGDYITVEYDDTDLSYALYQSADLADGEIEYSQSFTNMTDAIRYFAVFCSVSVEEDGRAQQYYLVRPQNEDRLLGHLQMYSQYAELDTAICYSDGKYLARDAAFRGENFYDYLYNYNDLSLDQKNAVRESVQSDTDGTGALAYLDYSGRDCIFAYAACGETAKWDIIVAVPTSEFVSEQLLSFFPLVIIIFLVILLAFNTWRLLLIVKELSSSVKRERIASASKSTFLSRMSHEIRTPLNAVIGYNAIAKSSMAGAKDDSERKQAEMKVMDCLDKSEIASKHLLTIINDVLDMSAIESGKIQVDHERFDFRGLITSLTTVFYSQAREKGVDFEVVFNTLTEEWFVGDQMRTNQVLTNLLSNAIKFTPEGGRVTLTIHQPDAAENAAHIRFEVADSGIGMTDEYISHLWTPFEQEDSSISRRFGGTGLGLSITKNLIDLMGGTITVDSVHGKGTTFSVDLTFERTAQPVNTGTYDFGGVNALVVDDDAGTCDYIRLLFNRCGARCATVTSGKDALKAITVAEKRGEPYSMCLVDWRMPHMDGIETVRQMRQLIGDKMPIIVLTAYDYSEIAERAAEVGVSRFISKPLFQSSLFDLLANQNGTPHPREMEKNKSLDFAGARILLTEDNAMNMEIAKVILKSVDLAVDSAWNGREAVEMFEAAPAGTYVAILMDVHMPVMDGHEATRAIRASSHPDANTIPIIAMTADAFAENVAEAHASGMNDHIAKPIDIPALFETLKRNINK